MANPRDISRTYKNKSYTLDDQLERSISFSCAKIIKSKSRLVWSKSQDSVVDAEDLFYPSLDDLKQIVWTKVLSIPRLLLVEIWNDPDGEQGGVRGLSKFILAVAENAALDHYRSRKLRAREVLALSLNAPTTIEHGDEGVNEDTGTLADTISDELSQPQAFQFEDLRGALTDQEYNVLYETTVNGASQTELAKEFGKSDSALNRVAIRAKDKARKWLDWLRRCSYKQAKAHIALTFSCRPSLRPDKINKAAAEHWHTSLLVVAFRDPASEWRPRITNQARVRAKQECYNAACQNGLAIGSDNLVLPAARRHEAVRFLPAITGKANRLCPGCEKVKKAAEQQARERAAFFSTKQLNSISETRNIMDYKQAAEVIKKYDIPRTTVARLAGWHLPEMSAWLGGKLDVSEEKRERASLWIADIARMIEAMGRLRIKVDLKDIENVRYLVQKINDAEMQIPLPLASPQELHIAAD